MLSRLGADIARRWLLGIVWPVERVTDVDESRATAILARYTDKTFSYTDATSFAVMERLGLKAAFAVDPHFHQYGFRCSERHPTDEAETSSPASRRAGRRYRFPFLAFGENVTK